MRLSTEDKVAAIRDTPRLTPDQKRAEIRRLLLLKAELYSKVTFGQRMSPQERLRVEYIESTAKKMSSGG
jgi:hypothetical protein